MQQRAPTVEGQMIADWAAVGLRRLEVHLATHAAFLDFLEAGGRVVHDDTARDERDG